MFLTRYFSLTLRVELFEGLSTLSPCTLETHLDEAHCGQPELPKHRLEYVFFTNQLLFSCLLSFISPSTHDFLNCCAFSSLQKCEYLHIHFESDCNEIAYLCRMVFGILSYEMMVFFSCFLLSFQFLMR